MSATLSPSSLHGPTALTPPCVTVIEPARGWLRLDLADLWPYRDLLRLLAMRDIKVRYKQTALGAAWAILQPLLSMIVLSVVFGQILGVAAHVGDTPYPVFLYAALLPWTFFAAAVTASAQSLVNNANLLGKVYFPRLIVPLAALGSPLVDYAVAATVLGGLMLWYGVAPGWALLLLPALVASTIVAALGVGVVLAALTVSYRDFRHVVPFMIQVWFFLTPVIVPTTLVPARLAWLIWLNPMGGTIAAFRAAVLGTPVPYAWWACSTAVAAGCLLVGLFYFSRTERHFADVV